MELIAFGLEENEIKSEHNSIDLAEQIFIYLNSSKYKSLDYNPFVNCHWVSFEIEWRIPITFVESTTLNGNTLAFFPFDLFSGLQLFTLAAMLVIGSLGAGEDAKD